MSASVAPGYNSSLDMDNVHTPASDYSTYSHNMMSTSGPFYSQTVPADLNGSLWDATSVDGAQNFHGEPDFPFSFGHITPRANGQDPTEDDVSGKWMSTEEAPAVVAEPMRRMTSQSSASSSHKNRTIKASSMKSRPRILSTVSQGSHMSNFDLSGNGQADAFLLHDSDAHSVSSQMFYPMPMSVGMMDTLSYTPDMLASSMGQQHMDPTQMRLNFDASLTGNSPTASWSDSLSPIGGSRTSSPAITENPWSHVPVGSSSQGSTTSHVLGIHSPTLSHHPENSAIATDDFYGGELLENAIMPPAYTRRSSNDGEPTARDHHLYKNAMPQADGLFHCPWEGQSSCNHKPEKLKCNYDKFVDSHLKPYRCKVDSCENARFSSTACLLRHEREAHAMHGHGDKPYLCTYEGCDRAVPGCGFPRNWNLRDHMRRVHNDNGSSLSMATAGSSHPSSSRASQSAAAAASSSSKGRKRKSKDVESSSSSSRKPSSKPSAAEEAAAAAAKAEAPLIEQWWSHRNALQSYLQRFDNPIAFEVLEQSGEAAEHFAAIEKITRRLKKSRDPHRRSYLQHAG